MTYVWRMFMRPGATCDSQCQAQSCLQRCGGDSLCTNGRCTCPSGTYDYEGTCIPLAIDPITHSPSTSTRSLIHSARPGDRCDVTILCTGGSTCILGTCTCDQGYIPSFDRSSCIFAVTPITQRSYPGGECVRDDDCAGNSICIKRICSCQNNDELKDNQCVKSLLKTLTDIRYSSILLKNNNNVYNCTV
uniref:EB domain-containing protein n=1 Tax=Heterorhabditis bacteriophora TaxID=37862 RepID=A0A1I7X012_HETBA